MDEHDSSPHKQVAEKEPALKVQIMNLKTFKYEKVLTLKKQKEVEVRK